MRRGELSWGCRVGVQTEIIRLKQVDHIMSEKAILAAINHPMIISLYGTSQDDLHLYMYMEFVSGGELFSHLRRAGRFTNDTGKFFAASIVLALQHLHALDIVYRDLKVSAQIFRGINFFMAV